MTGEIDSIGAPVLRDALRDAGGHGEIVHLDLVGVSYLDSAAVRELFVQAQAGLRLHCLRGSAVESVLRIVGLHDCPGVRVSTTPRTIAAVPAGGQPTGSEVLGATEMFG